MRRFLTVLFLLLAAAVFIPIGVSNRQPATLNLDPFGRTPSPFAIDMPLSLLMFLLLMLGVLIGGLATWLGQGKWRRLARLKSREAFQWKGEADRLARERDGNSPTARPVLGRRGEGQTAKLVHGR